MDIIQRATEILHKTFPEIKAIYLFGSTGTEFENKESDLDLAVLTNQKIDQVTLWDTAQAIAKEVKRDVDLIDLYVASTVFRYQIITTGTRIYARDEIFCAHFENMVIGRYFRFNDLRRDIIKDIEKRGKIL